MEAGMCCSRGLAIITPYRTIKPAADCGHPPPVDSRFLPTRGFSQLLLLLLAL